MALPHIQNSEAGRNLYDPMHTNMFEVYFTLPEPLRAQFGKDEMLLTEHVLKIGGLDALHRAPEVGQQKFMGTDRSYIIPKLDSTHAEISIDFTLNLRDKVDNYIYKLLKAWSRLGYDITSGKRSVKKEYCANWFRAAIANREGDIIEDVVFKDVMMAGPLEGFDELDYDNGDAAQITAKFVSDWWTDVQV